MPICKASADVMPSLWQLQRQKLAMHTRGSASVACRKSLTHMERYRRPSMSEDLRAALHIHARQNRMRTAQCLLACPKAISIARHSCSCVMRLTR